MIAQKEVTIGSDRYVINALGGLTGLRLGKKIAKVLLPAMSKVFGEEEASMGEIMEVVSDHIDELDDQIVVELIGSVTKNNMRIDFDKEFERNYNTLFKLLWEVIQFNYSDLLFPDAPEEEGM